MKTLQIVECAYRATFEEQDDTVLWITRAMRGAGADLAVLLCANAVAYAARGQTAEGLVVGTWRQTQPPQIAADLAALREKDVPVLAVKEDLEERGLTEPMLLPGIAMLRRAELAALVDRYDRVWHW
jgi:sulfur transfer complex TusBCD TusB component (DsrH family)